MRCKLKKMFSFILSLALIISLMPVLAAAETESYMPLNFMAIAGNGQLTLSWKNINTSNVARIELYDENNSRLVTTAATPKSTNVKVKSSSDNKLKKTEAFVNNVLITGLTNLNRYTYRLKITDYSGGVAEFYTTSAILSDSGNNSFGDKKSITGFYNWETGNVNADYVHEELQIGNAYEGSEAVLIKSFLGNVDDGSYSYYLPELKEALVSGEKYILTFMAKSNGVADFECFYGDKDNKEAVLEINEVSPFDWKEYSLEFEDSGKNLYILIDGCCDELYLDNFVLAKCNSYSQPEGENLIKNGGFEEYDSESKAVNFIAVARDKALSVSWTNPDKSNISKILVYNQDGEIIKDSETDEINLNASAVNYFSIGGLSNGRTYKYTLTILFANGEKATNVCESNVLNDMGQLLWGAPMGSQSVYGWRESVYGLPYVKYETCTDESYSGSASLLFRSNTGNGITNIFQQFGPNLSSSLEEGSTYRLSYWVKNVKAKPYVVYAGDKNYTETEENSDWKKVTLPDFTYDGTDFRFKIDKSAEAIYVDDIELYKVENGVVTGENLIVNGDFETVSVKIGTYEKEIKSLIDECEKRGFSTDYETSQYMVLKYCKNYLQSDVEYGVSQSQLEYNLNAIDDVYRNAKKSLEDKLSGVGENVTVPRFVTSPITIDKSSFKANVQKDGKLIENYPVLFQGWVGYDMLRSNLDDIYDFGFNIIQQEIGPNSIIVPADNEKGYTTDTSGAATLLKTLERAEKLNLSVNVLVSPHYMPGFMYELYPEISATMPGFISYDVTNPVVTEMMREYLNALIPLIKDSPALHSICLTNEPEFHSVAVKNNPTLTARWHKYLEEQYGTISKLNSAYSASYSKFTDVAMPVNPSDASAPKDDSSPIYSDYIMFNYTVFGDFHKLLADTIKELAPDVPLHAKIQSTIFVTDSYGRGGSREITYRGNDHEYLADFLDINGNDAVSNYYTNHWFKDMEKSFFYDLQRSYKNVPVYNSEEHLQWAGNSYFGYEVARQMYNDLWQGTIHGKSASTMWIWDKTYNSGSANYNSILHRPDALEQTGKAALDMMRLSPEITKLQQKKSDVALLYSHYARNYDSGFLARAVSAYTASVMSGQKVHFVTDKSIEQLKDYKMLIVPGVCSVKDETAEAIAEFAENGGKVLLIGSGNFKYNEHKESTSARNSVISRITNKADLQTSVKTADIRSWLYNNGLGTVQVVDAVSGEIANSIEWQWVKDGNEWLINITNYGWNDADNVKILIDGNEPELLTDLINGEEISGSFKLTAHKPRLLKTVSEEFSVAGFKYLKDGKAIGKPAGSNVTVTAKLRNLSDSAKDVTFKVDVCNGGEVVNTFITKADVQPTRYGEYAEISVTGDFPVDTGEFDCDISVTAEEEKFVPSDFIAVGRDKSMTLSWKNPERNDIADIKLFREDGSVIASVDEANIYTADSEQYTLVKNADGIVVYKDSNGNENPVSGKGIFAVYSKNADGSTVSNGKCYAAMLEITFKDGTVYNNAAVSNVLNDRGSMKWGNPMGTQEIIGYGWEETVSSLPFTKFTVTTKEKYNGRASLLVQSNLSGARGETYIQLGPKLSSPMQSGKSYKFSYWIKAENADWYAIGYGGRWGNPRIEDVPGTIDWTQKSITFTIDEGNTPDDIRFQFERGAEALYIDNCELYEVDADGTKIGDNLLVNGGFESCDLTRPSDVSDVSVEIDADNNTVINWTSPSEDYAYAKIYKEIDGNAELIAASTGNKVVINNQKGGIKYIIKACDRLGNSADGVSVISPEFVGCDEFVIKDSAGNIAGNVLSGTYTASVRITNNYLNGKYEPVLVAAVYKDGNILVSLDTKTAEILKGESKNLTAEVTVPDDGGNYTIKAFVLESFESLIPAGNIIICKN